MAAFIASQLRTGLATSAILSGSLATAQQPGWQPTRISANQTALPLSNQPSNSSSAPDWNAQRNVQSNPSQAASSQAIAGTSQQGQQLGGGGVVLRWKRVAPPQQPATSVPASASGAYGTASEPTHSASTQVHRVVSSHPGPELAPNPLRSPSAVRPVSYVQENAPDIPSPFDSPPTAGNMPLQGDPIQGLPAQDNIIQPPFKLPGGNAPGRFSLEDSQPQSGTNVSPSILPEFNDPPALPRDQTTPMLGADPSATDPLTLPELAPDPNAIVPRGDNANQLNPGNLAPGNAASDDERPGSLNPFPGQPAPTPPNLQGNGGPQDPSPLDRDAASSPLDEQGARQELAEPKRSGAAGESLSCEDQRNRSRLAHINSISLNVSPTFGEGYRAAVGDTEEDRLDFAASSKERSWRDFRGQLLATGRLVDLRDDRAILDVSGSERAIPLLDLSDSDIAYIGQSWNIPLTCGVGYEKFEGRNFIASTVQWTASGACNKPLYFQDVQLERYGHETGPILQPMLSTAHFFGSIAVLPYKMGVHPPNECQYSLGYIRPGNCAPYMLQPIPWSLRGAAAQAGFISGAAALIP